MHKLSTNIISTVHATCKGGQGYSSEVQIWYNRIRFRERSLLRPPNKFMTEKHFTSTVQSLSYYNFLKRFLTIEFMCVTLHQQRDLIVWEAAGYSTKATWVDLLTTLHAQSVNQIESSCAPKHLAPTSSSDRLSSANLLSCERIWLALNTSGSNESRPPAAVVQLGVSRSSVVDKEMIPFLTIGLNSFGPESHKRDLRKK